MRALVQRLLRGQAGAPGQYGALVRLALALWHFRRSLTAGTPVAVGAAPSALGRGRVAVNQGLHCRAHCTDSGLLCHTLRSAAGKCAKPAPCFWVCQRFGEGVEMKKKRKSVLTSFPHTSTNVIPANAGIQAVVDSRIRGNDDTGLEYS